MSLLFICLVANVDVAPETFQCSAHCHAVKSTKNKQKRFISVHVFVAYVSGVTAVALNGPACVYEAWERTEWTCYVVGSSTATELSTERPQQCSEDNGQSRRPSVLHPCKYYWAPPNTSQLKLFPRKLIWLSRKVNLIMLLDWTRLWHNRCAMYNQPQPWLFGFLMPEHV